MFPPTSRRGILNGGRLSSRLSGVFASASPVVLCAVVCASIVLLIFLASYLPAVLLPLVGVPFSPQSPSLSHSQSQSHSQSPSVAAPAAARSSAALPSILEWRPPTSPAASPAGQEAVAPLAPPVPVTINEAKQQQQAAAAGGKERGQRKQGGGGGGESQAPASPSVASPSPSTSDSSAWRKKAEAVKAGFVHAYSKYEGKCFGQDEYRPLSGQCYNWMGAALTIIDALPTMHVMGLTSEFDRAVSWLSVNLRFETSMMTSFFETTIRVLGGLVSAYDLSGNTMLLDKARLLGDKLLPVFNTPTGLPLAQINLATGGTAPLSWTGGSSLLAELGTCQMEFFSLSERTKDSKYALKSQKPIDVIDKARPAIPGLYPIYISPHTGQFTNNRVAWGAMGDSFYEYLLKMYLLTGKQHDQYRRMYIQSMSAMLEHLYQHTPSGTAYIADMEGGQLDRKMDHLVCFAPGMLALGVKHGVVSGAMAESHMDAAVQLMRTCYNMYHLQQPSGIGAEYSRFTPEMTPGHDASYKLRPETVESLFVMWRVTGDVMYREWGWEIWSNIDKHCRVDGGYAALLDVRQPDRKEDKMESFFLAETLKYLYLLFEDNDLIPIFPTDDNPEFYVFNTECHPIKVNQHITLQLVAQHYIVSLDNYILTQTKRARNSDADRLSVYHAAATAVAGGGGGDVLCISSQAWSTWP